MVVELANRLKTPENMFYYVRDEISYLPEQKVDLWTTARTTLLNRMGDCDDQAILLSSLLWSKGFTNRIVMSHLITYDSGHMYVELIGDNNQVLKLDPTCVECGFGKFPKVEEEIIGYVYPEKSQVVSPRLYQIYVGQRFQFKYDMGCNKLDSHCKPYCSVCNSNPEKQIKHDMDVIY